MLQDPISKPPDVQMEGARAGTDRRNKPNNANPEQVLKCPRCDSLNTKFCYYNNYSLTQPRHFCKNCRRYWTQGGSLRNVPIGGGCRKNKRVKQRTVDPHMFGGLDDHGFLQHAGGSAGGLLSSSCFGGPGGSGSVPGFGDLMPSNDSHLLSMAFSRLQESLRLGEHTAPNNSAGKLSLLGHSSPLYDNGSCGLVSNYSAGASNVKPEHVYNNVNASSSDQLGCNLFDPSSTSSHLGSATASLASLEEQLTSFGVPNMVDAFNSCSLEAQLKLQHQKQLALHLGAPSDHRNMPSTDPTNASSSNGGSSVVENGRAHPHAAHHHQQHRHHALPDFEDHESPESMSSIMMRRGHAAASKGKVMSMGIDGRGQLLESWQQGGGAGHEGNMNNMLQAAQAQQQHVGGEQQMNLYHESVISGSAAHGAAAGDQQMSFWSPSPWTDHHHVHTQLAGSTAGALL